MNDFAPKWHKEIEIFEKIKSILILEGNVMDQYQFPVDTDMIPKGSISNLPQYLYFLFKHQEYENIVFYDSIRGFYNKLDSKGFDSFSRMVNMPKENNSIPASFKSRNQNGAPQIVRNALIQNNVPTVIIMDFASRYIADPVNMEQTEIDSYTILMQAAMEAKEIRTEKGNLKNLLILLTNKVNDLPAWFYLDNPFVKTITLKTPGKEERSQFVKGNSFKNFFESSIYDTEIPLYQANPEELKKIQDRFIGLTEGFSFMELRGLSKLCKNKKYHINEMCDVIDLYKFGIKENPWKSLDYKSFVNAYSEFEKRVKGQPYALTKTLDIVKRAMTGMSNISSSTNGKPKGVLFFAGPTGTGKTETAKTLAEKLFGDESSCVRFDMSEFSQSHSDQRLLGAPPGYVGYESGGQLTNAVKNNPFCILLFDEIEKAHPSILDKFLQILEDGRMTDGKGETVYFSEAIIIFTSNLGISKIKHNGEREQVVDSSMSYDELQKTVRKGIENYFKQELGRPEILNRIGENIVVFDFIREDVAMQILKSQLNKIVLNMKSDLNINLSISDTTIQCLQNKVIGNLENGGRGIGNIVESYFVNPLSRYMFDQGVFNNKTIIVNTINDGTIPYSLNCSIK